MPNVVVLDVKLYGETIGALTHVGGDRTLFSFSEAYMADARRPTLGIGFKDEFGQLMTDFAPTQRRLLPFFSNLLPEGYLRDYLAERAKIHPEREFYLLAALGRDLPGALTVEPADGQAWLPISDSGSVAEIDSAREKALRFSLAGVQLKFSAIQNTQGNKGLTIPASGVGGSWIVKLPGGRFEGLPENEFAIMTLARLVGIDVPDIRLINLDDIGNLPEGIGDLTGQAFATKRFDRTPDGPIHIEDFAQVFRVYPEEKYKNASYRVIAAVLAAETGEKGVEEFIRRLTFSVLTGNADMHLKNWSLIYRDRRTPALSPAYDLVSTIAYLPDQEAALKFAKTKRFDGFTLDELSTLASKAKLPQTPVLRTAKETIARFLDIWEAEKRHLPQFNNVTEAIDAHLKMLRMEGWK